MRRAYTLLELVLVLAILGIVLAAAAPSLRSFAAGRKAEDAARQFVAVTRWARSQAVSDGVSYKLVIDPNAGTWQLELADDQDEAGIPPALARVFTSPEDVSIQTNLTAVDGQLAITFDPTGRNEVAEIHFIGPESDVTVSCGAPSEDFRVLKDAEVHG